GGAGPGGARYRRTGPRRHRRRAAAGGAPVVQSRGGGGRRPHPGRGAQELPAQLRRILRSAPVQRGRLRRRHRDPPAGADRAVRRRAAVPDGKAAAVPVPRRDSRRRSGADPAVFVRGAGRRHGAGEPVRLEHRGRQVGLPPPAGGAAVGASPGGLHVYVGRPRRVVHRPGSGRPGA
ncbi:hypothetical protein OY671_010458, partial [Metschnikowia pulcherrima]